MNNPTNQLFQQAMTSHQQGDLDTAKNIYQQILISQPDHYDTLKMLGMLYLQQQQIEPALKHLQKALTIDNKDSTLYFYLASTFKAAQQYQQAIDAYHQALKISDKFPQAHNNLATVYQIIDDDENALRHYIQAVQLQPDYLEAHRNLAIFFLKRNQFENAQKQLQNVLELNPDDDYAQLQLANIALQQNDLNKAKKYLKIVLQHDPENIDALNNLGVLYLRQEQAQQAVDTFTQALALDNERSDIQENLAATFLHFDRFSQAITHFEQHLEQQPDNTQARYNLGVAYMSLAQNDQAKQCFQQVLMKDAGHSASLTNLGAIYWREKDYNNAQELFERVTAIEPNNESVKFMLATIRGEQKTSMPDEYIENLFDYYAPQYDKHMQETLQYCLPNLISDLMAEHFTVDSEHAELSILDLGCGTGLVAEPIKLYAQKLIGVDVSEKMLALAEKKVIYDQLIQQDLHTYLNSNTLCFDVIICADVFAYIGDLQQTLEQIKQHLTEDGILIFSVEYTEQGEYQLQSSGRFAYNKKYIKQLLMQVGYLVATEQDVVARMEDNQPVNSGLFVCNC